MLTLSPARHGSSAVKSCSDHELTEGNVTWGLGRIRSVSLLYTVQPCWRLQPMSRASPCSSPRPRHAPRPCPPCPCTTGTTPDLSTWPPAPFSHRPTTPTSPSCCPPTAPSPTTAGWWSPHRGSSRPSMQHREQRPGMVREEGRMQAVTVGRGMRITRKNSPLPAALRLMERVEYLAPRRRVWSTAPTCRPGML